MTSNLVFQYSAHKRLWLWATDHPYTELDWPEWKNFPYTYNDCFACDYASKACERKSIFDVDKFMCDHCPLNWPDNLTCNKSGSLFATWDNALTDEITKKHVAALISKVPVKKGVLWV